jgi:hypothetical protein
MFIVQRRRLIAAFCALAAAYSAGPVRAANWGVFDETQMMPVCYDRDGIFLDNQGFTHFIWRFKHKSCTDELSVSTEIEAAIRCTRDVMSSDIKGFSRLRGPQVDEQLKKFGDDTFERGTQTWRLARAICGKSN